MNIFVHAICIHSSNYLIKMNHYYFMGKGRYILYILYLQLELSLDNNVAFVSVNIHLNSYPFQPRNLLFL